MLNSGPFEVYGVWEHPHVATPLSSVQSCFTSQLSFLCAVTNPRTDPDNSHLTVTAYSVLCSTSEQLSPSLSLQSMFRDSQPTTISHHSTVLSRSLLLCLTPRAKTVHFRAPASWTPFKPHPSALLINQ